MPVKQEMGVLHMTESTITRVKKIQLFLFAVAVIMLFFSGCGGQEPDRGIELEGMAVSLSGGVDINTMGTEEWKGAQNLEGTEGANGVGNLNGAGNADTTGNPEGTGNVTEPKTALNPNEATVIYQGMDYMSSCRTIGGDSIYSTGYQGKFDGSNPADGPYFAGRIGIEEDEIQQFSLEIPEGMFVYRGCTDSQGRWHLLLSQKTGNAAEPDKKTEIWIVNREGELEQSFDITECVKEGGRLPAWLAVDNGGIYYFASEESIRVIDAVNQSVQTLQFSGSICGIGIGRSGALYGVFKVEGEGNEFLGIVQTASGSIEKCAELPENNMRPTFSVLQAGVSTELLLANMGDGIWNYDGTELKQALTLENIVANGQDILAMGFLWDGRVCIMSYENGKDVFHYLPVES